MPRYGRDDERWWQEREAGRTPWPREGERVASREWSDRDWRDRDWRDRDWRDESWRARDPRSGLGEREEERREVMQGGDRGWPGGVQCAEGGAPYGTGMFGTAYGLYAGRPERETYRRHDEDWRHREGRGFREEARDTYPQYRGRPPRSYRRSDDRILDDIVERLMISAVDASEIEVKVENGDVTLSGTVRDRRDKRRIEDACEDVFGVQDVHNQIRVVRDREDELGGGVH